MTPSIFLKRNQNKFKNFHIILFVLFFMGPVAAVSQQRKTKESTRLILPSGPIRLDSLANLLARESGFVLSFDADRVDPRNKLTFPDTKISVEALLSYLQDKYRLTHKTIGNHIILYSGSSGERKAQVKPKVP